MDNHQEHDQALPVPPPAKPNTATKAATTNLVVRPLLPRDIPRCVDLYLAAFAGNAHSRACFPRGVPAVRRFWEDMLREEMADPDAVFLKVVEQEQEHGDESELIVAFAKWNRPKDEHQHEMPGLPAWPAGADAQLCEATFGEWARAHRRLMGLQRHWYLELLATDPAHQGRGAGSLLLRHGCERADVDGVEAYLEASPEGVRVYQRCGFAEVGRHEVYIAAAAAAAAAGGEGDGEEEEHGERYRYVNMYMVRPAYCC